MGLVSLLFVFWHLRLQGLLSLLPLALMLGFLAWRSNSLLPGILSHFVANGLQVPVTTLTSLGLVSNNVLGIAILLGALVGLPLAGLGIFMFWKWTPRPGGNVETPAQPARPPASTLARLATLLPLLGVAAVYLYSAYTEIRLSTDPNALAASVRDTLQYDSVPWTQPAIWDYQIRNILSQPVGTETCTVSPGEKFVDLTCAGTHQAYQVEYRGGTFMGGGGNSRNEFRWDRQTLGLIGSETVFEWDDGLQPARSGVTRQGDQLVLTGTDSHNQPHELVLPAQFILDGEWPFRLSALAFGQFRSGATLIAWPAHYVGKINSDQPLTHPASLKVLSPELVNVSAGNFQAYRVELSITGTDERQIAWYDVNEPHTLVKYDNSFETYQLISIR